MIAPQTLPLVAAPRTSSAAKSRSSMGVVSCDSPEDGNGNG